MPEPKSRVQAASWMLKQVQHGVDEMTSAQTYLASQQNRC
jgi:hypothetical protein